MKQRPQLALTALNLGLLGALAAFWWRLAPPWQPPPPLLPDPATLAPPVLAHAPLDAAVVQAIAERPLFAAGRRADAGDAAADAGGTDAARDIRLLGLLGSGERSVAIVSSGGRTRRVRQGEQLDGWTLQGNDGRSARFTRGESPSRELQMVHAPQPAVATPAATPAASAATPPPARDDDSGAARRARREARQAAQENR